MTDNIIQIAEEGKSKTIPIIPTSISGLYEMPWKDYLAAKNYNKDINKMCELCRKEQIDKYGKITIKCSGLKGVEAHIPEEVLNQFSEEEKEQIETLYNPYLYADKNLDIERIGHPKRMFQQRWYQEMMIRCSAKRKVVRCGRRVGKSYYLALDIWQRMTTNKNYKVLIVTPFLAQAKEIADNVRKMLQNTNSEVGTWSTLVESSRIAPVHEVILKNGSIMRAFTAGSGGAGAVRGQGADWIILDEADFIDQESYNSIIAILADNPDVELTCTSTPMGENILYKLSHAEEFREFHYPTFVLPHYNDSLDNDFRKNTDVAGYVQEIQAEFGLDSNVVFQPEFVDNCAKFELPDENDYLVNRDDYILSLGCDWNGDKVGTRICITGLSKKTGRISIARLDNVQKEGWTQVAAINKIVELNRQYNLDHIYVDEGFGESNVQQLKLKAIEQYGILPIGHPDLNLDKVVPVNFASTLELRDVVTNEIRKKYYKNFMVETVNRELEVGGLVLSGERSLPIVKQMKNYIIRTTTSNGRKIYEAKNKEVGDHDLDAYMLAVLAIHMEHDNILDKRRLSDVQIMPIERTDTRGYNTSTEILPRAQTEDLRSRASGMMRSPRMIKPSVSRVDKLTEGRSLIGQGMGRGMPPRRRTF